MKLIISLWVVLVCLAFFMAGQAQPELKFDQRVVYVRGLPSANAAAITTISDDQWTKIFSVYTHEAYLKKIDQPLAGKFIWSGDSILFEPDYPFAAGQTYHAIFSLKTFLITAGIKNESLDEQTTLLFSVPGEDFPPTLVQSVYPESDNLPENTLRIYIYFSAPMMPGEAYDHINLLQENGTEVAKAFLIVDQELWSPDRKRFTLLFDPGRIKRDLKSNIDLGTPLQQGEKYQLVIDSAWRDVRGNALGKSFKVDFSVGRSLRAKVSPQHWKVIEPLAASRGDVVVLFDRPMDHVLALKYISIESPSGILEGHATMPNDTTWKFTPEHPWSTGEYHLTILPLLEDVAGNNINNVFDLDLSQESRVNAEEPVRLPVVIKAFNE